MTDTSATIDGVSASGYMAVLPGSAEGPHTASGVPAEGPWLKDARGKDMYGDNTLTTDVDKDGYADVVIGLPCARSGEVDSTPEGGGRIVVSYGGRAGGEHHQEADDDQRQDTGDAEGSHLGGDRVLRLRLVAERGRRER